MNDELDSLSIEVLHDELLTDILCRLPCKSAFLCKCVSKRWRSLISEPDFAVQFLNTNHSRTTLEWTLLIETTQNLGESQLCLSNPSFSPSKFGLEFLPYDDDDDDVTVASTFKDLVLCYTLNLRLLQLDYHICNPQTEQWTTLPSSPLFDYIPHDFTATLVCEDCYDYDNDKDEFTRWRNGDYRYRVVIAAPSERYEYADNISLVVFISETQEWIEISLVIPTSELADPSMNKYDWFHVVTYDWFQVVACNKILYIRHGLQFGSFDPFNVTSSTSDNTSFMAKSLPLPGNCRAIMESEGRLYSVSVNNDTGLIIKELKPDADDNNESVMRWKVIIRKSTYDCPLLIESYANHAIVVGLDPMSLDRVYVMMERYRDRFGLYNDKMNDLCLWSTGPRRENCSIKPLIIEIQGTFTSAHMIQLQCWPTPVPQVSQKTMDTDYHRIYE